MYEVKERVRYSETDEEGILRLGVLTDFFQDCAYFELVDNGRELPLLLRHHLGWFVFFWQIEIASMPVLGDSIAIGTSLHNTNGMVEQRNFYLKNSQNETIVKANSFWSLYDLQGKTIVKIPSEIVDHRDVHTPLDMSYAGRRIRIDQRCQFHEAGRHRVEKNQLDSNHHLNNAKFIQMALSDLDVRNDIVNRVLIEYKHQAFVGDTVIVSSCECGKTTYVDFRTNIGTQLAVMSFVKH